VRRELDLHLQLIQEVGALGQVQLRLLLVGIGWPHRLLPLLMCLDLRGDQAVWQIQPDFRELKEDYYGPRLVWARLNVNNIPRCSTVSSILLNTCRLENS
jgi:hypothetical protein